MPSPPPAVPVRAQLGPLRRCGRWLAGLFGGSAPADSLIAFGPHAPVMQAVLRLPEDERVVLLLVTLRALSYADVAVLLGVPVETVVRRLARGRARLHRLLQDPTP